MAFQPSFFGTGSETSYTGDPTQPFLNTTLQDPNPGATDTLAIIQDGPGTLQGVGLTPVGPSSYVLPTGSPASVTSYLRGITFQYAPAAPGSTTTTQFTLSDVSSAGTSVSTSDFRDTYVAPPPADAIALNPIEYADGTFTLSGRVTSYRGADHVFVQTAGTSGVPSVGVPLAADGSFSYSVRPGQPGGFSLYASQPSGNVTASAQVGLTGQISGQPYVAEAQQFASPTSGERSTETFFRPDGSRRVDVQTAGQTVQSDHFDLFTNHAQPNTTFVFDPGHGLDAVRQFRFDGTDHDTLSFLGSDFGNDIAQVLQNTATVGGSALITDPITGDAVRLGGVTKAQLAHNGGDIAFHG